MKLYLGTFLIFGAQLAMAEHPPAPKIKVAGCTQSDSEAYKSIEIYGVVNDDFSQISGVATAVELNTGHVSIKALFDGGSGTSQEEGKSLSFKDIMQPGTTFSTKGPTGTMTVDGTEIHFSGCTPLSN